VWFFYVAIAFEFLFMITPFALYFYSAYTPALKWLNATPLTSWLTAFFLPHFSQSTSVLLNSLNSAGWWLAYAGLLLFLVSAIQLYGSKLFGKGAVTGWLYRFLRHPQYLALAILGLGVTLIWPRFLVLLTYVTMLFLYRALAQIEEARCVEKYGESYVRYQQKTGMFLPRFRARATSSPGPASRQRAIWRTITIYIIATLVALAAGLGLREHSLSSISSVYLDNRAILSPAILPRDELLEAYDIAGSAQEARRLGQPGQPPMLVYVVPAEWYMPDLPIDSHDVVREQGGHGAPTDFDHLRFRVLFMRIYSHREAPHQRDIVRKAYSTEPLLIVDVNLETGLVTGTSLPPSTVIWGEMSPPLM